MGGWSLTPAGPQGQVEGREVAGAQSCWTLSSGLGSWGCLTSAQLLGVRAQLGSPWRRRQGSSWPWTRGHRMSLPPALAGSSAGGSPQSRAVSTPACVCVCVSVCVLGCGAQMRSAPTLVGSRCVYLVQTQLKMQVCQKQPASFLSLDRFKSCAKPASSWLLGN